MSNAQIIACEIAALALRVWEPLPAGTIDEPRVGLQHPTTTTTTILVIISYPLDISVEKRREQRVNIDFTVAILTTAAATHALLLILVVLTIVVVVVRAVGHHALHLSSALDGAPTAASPRQPSTALTATAPAATVVGTTVDTVVDPHLRRLGRAMESPPLAPVAVMAAALGQEPLSLLHQLRVVATVGRVEFEEAQVELLEDRVVHAAGLEFENSVGFVDFVGFVRVGSKFLIEVLATKRGRGVVIMIVPGT